MGFGNGPSGLQNGASPLQNGPSGLRKGVAASAATFALAWLVFTVLNGPAQSLRAGDLTRADEGDLAALRADKYLQRVRETGDISFYEKARAELRGVRGSAAAGT